MPTTLLLAAALVRQTPTATPAAAAPVVAPAPDYAQGTAWLCRPGRTDACAGN